MTETSWSFLIQLSSRGRLTLPVEVRRALGLCGGDAFRVSVKEGNVVLEPVAATPIEVYTDERLAEFEENADITPEELARARGAWGL